MSERPSTSSGNRTFQPSAQPLRPNSSSGGVGSMSVTQSSTGTRTPPSEHRRPGITSSPRPKLKGLAHTSNTLCRNITIYGYCRYEGKGCAFNHDPHSQRLPVNGSGSLGRGKFNVDSPSFTPSTPPKTVISSKAADAAPFTPKSNAGTATPPVQPQFNEAINNFALSEAVDHQEMYHPNLSHGFNNLGIGDNAVPPTMNPYGGYGNVTASGQINPYVAAQPDIFYQSQPQYPLSYHLYAPTAPHPQKLLPFQKNAHDFFISDNRREELQRKMEATLQTLPSGSSLLPPSLNEYHALVPLDVINHNALSQVFGYHSRVYKVFSHEDAKAYVLRRVEGFRLSNESDIRIIQRWKKILSANIVTIHNAWTTTKFGDSSIVFVYDYHPLSKTLAEAHFGQIPMFAGQRNVPENVLWSYIVQISSALKIIHNSGLAARVIDLSKVLLTSKMRIRINCCGMLDVLRPDTTRSLQQHQQEDFQALGRLILCIATNNPHAFNNYAKNMDMVSKQYSNALRDNLIFLISGQVQGIDEFTKSIAPYVFQTFNSALHNNDSLEQDLMREVENGRLVRLMAKFGFINERPEFDHDPRWSETGDRYYLKLFRDYVFHSVDENGSPVIDLAHVLTCLNKLDAGVDEKLMLVSRDNLNCFVLSYKDIKRQLESAFQDLCKSRR